MPQTPLSYALSHRSDFVTQLKEWLTIPSISSQPAYKAEMTRAADWAADHMRQIGLENVAVMDTGGHPIVYGDWLHAAGAPTVLVYGHYDVQPVKPEEWTSPAFEPTERNDALYARGAADDKGETFVHLKAVEAYLKTRGTLPINIKFLIEGEEEVGSRNLGPFLKREAERLKADTVLISDTPWVGPGVPTIHVGLRGGCGMDIEIHGPANDLHSGLFGGAVQNPIHAAAQIISKLHDAKGRVTVPGFYDTVRPLSRAERNQTRRIPVGDEQILAETGAPRLWGETGYSAMERMGARPTLDILKFVGGGDAAAVTSTVRIRLACRLVPDQQPDDIYQKVHDYVLALAPDTVRLTIKRVGIGGPGVIFDPNTPGIKAAQTALRQTFGVKPVFARSGGGIPVVLMFKGTLGLPTLLMGFGLPDDGLHGPNEKFNLAQFFGGIDTSIRFMQAFGREGAATGDA